MGTHDQFAYLQMVLVLSGIHNHCPDPPASFLPVASAINILIWRTLWALLVQTGASFFLLSRTLGSAFRLFVVAIVLQKALYDALHVLFG
jgi:hypothetical protein